MAEKTSTNKSNNTYSAKLKSRYQNFLQEGSNPISEGGSKVIVKHSTV